MQPETAEWVDKAEGGFRTATREGAVGHRCTAKHAGPVAAYAVAIRYPGDQATDAEAESALEDCEIVRAALRLELKL